MTVITSRFWDEVEYDDDDFAETFGLAFGSYVIPGKINATKGDELRVVVSAVAGNVIISPGAAMVTGAYYETDDDVEVTLTAALGFHLIVLRRDSTNNQVRPAIISSTASPPAIPSPVSTTDLPLALVRGETGVAVPVEDIRDARVFYQMGYSGVQGTFTNLFPNSEFYGQSGGASVAPDRWILVNTPTTAYVNSDYRGKLLSISHLNAGEGLRINIPIPPDESLDDNLYTFACYHETVANDGVLNIYGYDGSSETLLKTINLWRSSSTAYIIERVSQLLSAASLKYQSIIIEFLTKNAGSTDTFYIGDMALNKGYVPTDGRWNNELIWYDYPITDASWNLSAYSTANNTIDLTASFTNCFAIGARGIIAKIQCRDSASAAAATLSTAVLVYHIDQTPGTDPHLFAVSCAGLPNDDTITRVVFIPLDPGSTTPSFILRTVASGVATLDVDVELLGILT